MITSRVTGRILFRELQLLHGLTVGVIPAWKGYDHTHMSVLLRLVSVTKYLPIIDLSEIGQTIVVKLTLTG